MDGTSTALEIITSDWRQIPSSASNGKTPIKGRLSSFALSPASPLGTAAMERLTIGPHRGLWDGLLVASFLWQHCVSIGGN